MFLTTDCYEEINQNDREFQQLDAEYTLSYCYAMVCSQMSN